MNDQNVMVASRAGVVDYSLGVDGSIIHADKYACYFKAENSTPTQCLKARNKRDTRARQGEATFYLM